MKNYPENECSCEKCASMCEHRPCWGTPNDVEKMMAQEPDLAKRLQEDYWVSTPDDIRVPSPAVKGYEGRRAPLFPQGVCTFLENGLCTLHDKGLKPLEGRVATCKKGAKITKMHEEMRADIVQSWNTPEGKATLAKWRRLVGIDKDAGAPPTGLEMLMELGRMVSQIKTDKILDK